jgi:ferredoxin hydrogenase
MRKRTRQKITRRKILQTAVAGIGFLVTRRRSSGQFDGFMRRGLPLPLSRSNPAIRHLDSNCVECGRCRDFCHEVTTVFGYPVPDGEDECIHCGQCTLFCMVEALTEQYHYPLVAKAITDPKKVVVASTAPSVRVSLGEMFRQPPGTNVEGKTVAALKKLGVDYVLDTTFAADLTVMEEASELLKRLELKDEKLPLPMLTSCCPSWVRFAGLFYPKLLPHLSTAKSPVLMQGAVVKTYFAQKKEIEPANIFHVALTPCTAKKSEILLPGMNASGVFHHLPRMRDVDVALTTRELAYLLKEGGIDFVQLPDTAYDSIMGTGSGAGLIFGNTGGVTESILRTAFQLQNNKKPPQDFYELKSVRGLKNIREATIDFGHRKLEVAIIHGIGYSRPLLELIQNGGKHYDFIEVMACPGGCIGGGGQPYNNSMEFDQLRRLRINALYRRDSESKIRLSNENHDIETIYADFLKQPLSTTSRQLLHCSR